MYDELEQPFIFVNDMSFKTQGRKVSLSSNILPTCISIGSAYLAVTDLLRLCMIVAEEFAPLHCYIKIITITILLELSHHVSCVKCCVPYSSV
jgi:hypothetical protein